MADKTLNIGQDGATLVRMNEYGRIYIKNTFDESALQIDQQLKSGTLSGLSGTTHKIFGVTKVGGFIAGPNNDWNNCMHTNGNVEFFIGTKHASYTYVEDNDGQFVPGVEVRVGTGKGAKGSVPASSWSHNRRIFSVNADSGDEIFAALQYPPNDEHTGNDAFLYVNSYARFNLGFTASANVYMYGNNFHMDNDGQKQLWIGKVDASKGLGTAGVHVKTPGNYIALVSQNHSSTSTNYAGLYHYATTGHATARWIVQINPSNGNASFNTTSDRRFKTNINDLSEQETKDFLSMSVKDFYYKLDDTKSLQNGIIAQDLKNLMLEKGYKNKNFLSLYKLHPQNDDEAESIFEDITLPEEEYRYELNYPAFIPNLIHGWQIHEKKIAELEEENAYLRQLLNER